MLSTWLRKLANPKSLTSGRRPGTAAPRKLSRRLRLEPLEDRLTPATHTWTGVGVYWSDPTSWTQDPLAPALTCDHSPDLVFPASAWSNNACVNDLTGCTVRSITFTGGYYDLTGNPISLTGGITVNAGQIGTVHLGLVLPIVPGYFPPYLQAASGGDLDILGSISGPGSLMTLGQGQVGLAGPGTYAGSTYIGAETWASGNNALPAGTAVTVNAGYTLGLAASQTIGSLAGAGRVDLAYNGVGLCIDGNGTNTTFSGTIDGYGDLYLYGRETLTLSGTNTYTGTTQVAEGTLLVTGSLSASSSVSLGSIFNAGATLGGTGTVGAITVGMGGNVEAGVNGSGTLHCSSAVFNVGSTFTAHVGAKLSATGKIDLSGSPALFGPSDFYAVWASNTILQGATITGKFSNTFYSNGNYFLALGSELFLVQYTSTGVVLTRII
jgi:autotransporter-associated beta strand protein